MLGTKIINITLPFNKSNNGMSTKFSIYCVKAGYKLKISVISTSLSPITILKVYNTEVTQNLINDLIFNYILIKTIA